jgi:hypothetical protein
LAGGSKHTKELKITVSIHAPVRDDEIWLKRDGSRFTGKTIADSALLNAIIGRRYFSVEDYDDVLTKVSEQGYWLVTEGGSGEPT